MALELKRAADVPISDLADVFTRSFAGYIGGSAAFDTLTMAGFLSRENIDLTVSRLLVRDGELAGMIHLSRQGWTSRVAAMGIVPEAQSQGVGAWFLSQIIDEARSRGERAMVLECIEQNTRALRLYQRLGFTVVRRLYGYAESELAAVSDPALKEIDILEAAKQVMLYGDADLPWQVSGTAVARFGPPFRAYRLGHAYAVISDPSVEAIAFRALITVPEFRRQGDATRLMQALKAQFPGKQWSVPAIFPEEMGIDFFEKRGVVRKELNQVQMVLTL